ncbi:MAG TPA: acyloxyacyl hydrolase [Burkholderiales bacterium]
MLVLLAIAPGAAAEPAVAAFFGRATGGKEVDVARLAYRRALEPDARWWWPTHLQLGASIWRVPDISGTTRRYDVNATAVWRKDTRRGYFEAGFGPYLLSRSINNPGTHLPSELQFGSHVGAGLRLGKASAGIALQHISNAGIEQPNGGIDFVQLTVTLPL